MSPRSRGLPAEGREDGAVTPARGADRAPSRPAPARRRRVPRAWVPNQHGAWAMVVAPPVVGALVAGPTGWHALLVVAWLAAYCLYFAATQWLRSGRRPRYRSPVLGYAAATAVLGVPLLVAAPALLRWAPAFAVLLGVSLRYAARRADRSYGNDLVTIAAAVLLTVVAAGLGGTPAGWWPPGATGPRPTGCRSGTTRRSSRGRWPWPPRGGPPARPGWRWWSWRPRCSAARRPCPGGAGCAR